MSPISAPDLVQNVAPPRQRFETSCPKALGLDLGVAPVCAPPVLSRQRLARLNIHDDPIDLSAIQRALDAQDSGQRDHDVIVVTPDGRHCPSVLRKPGKRISRRKNIRGDTGVKIPAAVERPNPWPDHPTAFAAPQWPTALHRDRARMDFFSIRPLKRLLVFLID